MDAPANQVSLAFSPSSLKEPRGFLRVLQFIFSIFAFATTSGFSNYCKYVRAGCNNLPETKFDFSYPFRIQTIFVPDCNGSDHYLTGDFSSQSQYFVASGVLAFLYCIASLGIYLFCDKMYRENMLAPMVDFGITVIMAVFWLTSSAAWSQGVADLKYFSNPTYFFMWCPAKKDCVTNVVMGSFATLNVSLILGYLNFALWAANLWFLFKETPWFITRTEQKQPGAQ